MASIFAAGAAHSRSAPDSFADLAEQLLPSVVNVATSQKVKEPSMTGDEQLDEFFKDFFDRQRRNEEPRRQTSLGSGFIIDAAGYVVTNNHVIAEAEEITVRLHDETELKATIVGRDEKTDLALLKVEPKEPLPALAWGDSDELRIGDWVMAIGNPFGLGGTVTAGIVSARGRNIDAGPYDDFIQTDASINKGNSGGPLFNLDGEVIGINTAIFSQSGGSVGIGFAIPSVMAKNIIAQIREFGRPRRGWLGVRIQSVNDELAEGLRLKEVKGALVANVTPGGPAEVAGIKQGDVVLTFDGREVTEMRSLPRMVAETPINKEVEVVVSRQGTEMTFQVVLGELDEGAETASATPPSEAVPAPPVKEGKIETLGLSLAEISPATRERFNLDEDVSGVVVTEVIADGPSATKGIQVGDVIVEVDQQAVASPAEVDSRVKDAKGNGYRVVTLLVYREGDFQWVAVRIAQG
ncbi:MAG: DegQ family serine endoprotease [Dongiaceae bacterium]